ncbi:ABC transporter permease [Deminuibacter soli]|uniref:ABC transporter permease n=1 Tax=Deminuibacter soli TaxID=2291815 RepID=A0A3E1ND85_9BACT|nr:ABC transporter permease [Deminuibacter soli]RFM25791.1 ABC transporter permease [Deminuibacter soli]
MFSNYIKIAWRNLMKSKMFSFINILGLTIGITVCMMIFLFIMHETSVDKFHKNGNDIYRVMRGIKNDGKDFQVAYLSGPYGPALQNDFRGQISKMVRVNSTDGLVTIGNRSFHEKKIVDVDPDFFTLFTFPLIKGNPATILNNPSVAVLTETTAKRYFGSVDNAMGKVIQLDKSLQLKVAGIAKDVPSNSHLDFDLVVPISNYANTGMMTVWINNGLFTYVQLAPHASREQLEKMLPDFMERHMGTDMRKLGYHFTLMLKPLQDVYFSSATYDGDVRHGDKSVVYIFLSIAALILLIGCINFINLSTVRAIERSKEVGLRKVMGALRKQIIGQFIGESVLVATISCLLSVVLLTLVMPAYSHLLGYSLSIRGNTGLLLLFMGGIVLVVGVLAGSYPALFMSNFTPFQALKGKLRLGKGGAAFRQGLVVVQFSISVFLIIGTLMMTKQLNFVKNKQLGYDKAQTLMIPIDNNDIYDHMLSFKHALESQSSIASVSMMSGAPGGFFDTQIFEVEGQPQKWSSNTEYADFEYVKTLGLKVIAGRDFSARYPTDTTNAVLINRTAAAKLGWTPQQALGKWIQNTLRDPDKRYVVGVVEDFNFRSLKEELSQLVISPAQDRRMTLIKIQPGQIDAAMRYIKAAYANAAPGYPLEYSFLDEQFNELYRNNLRQQTILTIFACLAIFVACLGLFGLASFTAAKRFKEIGVRKVLGSSVKSIVVLLSKDLLKPVLIATCIAIPAGYYAMHQWLQNFAYQTPMSFWVFLLAAFVTFGIALLTVSIKAVKAAGMNPVKSLRAE